jgi:hypothetical protein
MPTKIILLCNYLAASVKTAHQTITLFNDMLTVSILKCVVADFKFHQSLSELGIEKKVKLWV